MAIVAYITLLGLIIAFVLHQDERNRTELGAFHLRQMLGLILTSFASWIFNFVPLLGSLLSVVLLVGLLIGWVLGLVAAINEQREPIPIVGKFYQDLFRTIN